jgi:protein-L-isoaspartate(D-aspartate) O-methyltransferase
MVSIMNEALQLEVGNKVLEAGAGSGWHAATIAELVAPYDAPRSEWGHVYTLEIIKSLADAAKKTVMDAGYGDRVSIIAGDGSVGYKEKAPYDRILLTSAAPKIPQPLLDQLKTDGIMLIPVGDAMMFQTLWKIKKDAKGVIKKENLGAVSFVPLTGEYGQQMPKKKTKTT